MQHIQSLLRRGQWIEAALFRYRNRGIRHLIQLFQCNGQLLNRWCFKNTAQWKWLVQLFVNLRGQCRRPQGMSTNLEEVFLHADLRQAQHVLPDLRQLHFHPRPRCDIVGSALQAAFWCWQGLAVDFTVRCQRHLFQLYQVRRHHVVW